MDRVTIVGVGRMGGAVCARLVESGFEVVATDLLPARRADVEAVGARWADGLEVATPGAGIVVTVLPGPPEVSAIADPLTAAMAAGALWLDLSTASPAIAEAVRTATERRDIAVVDAPLGGSPEDARVGRLLSFAGGHGDDLDRARPVLEAIARKVVHVGPHGSGYLTKLIANALWFGQAVATAEALAIVDRAGLDVSHIQGALAQSAAGGGFVSDDAPALIAGDTMPAFSLTRCAEQLRSLQDAAADLGVPAEVLDAVAGVYAGAVREYGDVPGELLGARFAAHRAGVDFGA
ncbi:MAG TPA: NAD(P)-dependent oxidoreductase [Solirubrobacterales bacterium]|nr:NAD(P)-dependent oxidoreductase [Solirubrobacterales bacterium]